MPTLEKNRYGKHRVRVLRVMQDPPDQHQVCEIEADVLLSGALDAAYLSPDNSAVVPTDTVKNTIHLLAHDHLSTCRTHFAQIIGDHFLQRYAHLNGVAIELRERRWDRMTVQQRAHPHAFVCAGNGQWFSKADFSRATPTQFRAGLRDHLIMKTTGSGFVDFHQCELTTLPPTEDRILATRLSAEWWFEPGAETASFAATDQLFLTAAYQVFAERYSPSVQRTLFEIGEAFLALAPSVTQVALTLPNVHFLGLDLSRLGRPDQNRVFLPTDEPHGEIEAVITR